jgi:hypothetical protein
MKTKVCNECKIEKPESEFPMKDAKRRKGKCRKCCNRRQQQSRNARGYRRLQAYKNREKAHAYLGGKCANPNCPVHGDLPSCAMDFHHIVEKENNISDLWYKSWAKIKIELDKCVLLCAVCHRLVHAGLIECPKVDGDED